MSFRDVDHLPPHSGELREVPMDLDYELGASQPHSLLSTASRKSLSVPLCKEISLNANIVAKDSPDINVHVDVEDGLQAPDSHKVTEDGVAAEAENTNTDSSIASLRKEFGNFVTDISYNRGGVVWASLFTLSAFGVTLGFFQLVRYIQERRSYDYGYGLDGVKTIRDLHIYL